MTYVLETQRSRYIIYRFYEVKYAQQFINNNSRIGLEIVPNNHYLVEQAIKIAGNDDHNWPVELER